MSDARGKVVAVTAAAVMQLAVATKRATVMEPRIRSVAIWGARKLSPMVGFTGCEPGWHEVVSTGCDAGWHEMCEWWDESEMRDEGRIV